MELRLLKYALKGVRQEIRLTLTAMEYLMEERYSSCYLQSRYDRLQKDEAEISELVASAEATEKVMHGRIRQLVRDVSAASSLAEEDAIIRAAFAAQQD